MGPAASGPNGWSMRCVGSASTRRSRTARRVRSPVGNGSGSPSPAPSSGARGCWCATSRSARWTPPTATTILRLLDGLRRELTVGILLISHDLSSLAGIADRVVVLYRGRVVEDGPIADVFSRPRHPYTALLIASAPSIRRENRLSPAQLRPDAAGSPTSRRPLTIGGCVFAHRCPFATEVCAGAPALRAVPDRPEPGRGGWTAACHHVATWREQIGAATQPKAHSRSNLGHRTHIDSEDRSATEREIPA
ncbi:oligopeptide/dipeptide ABC transporter ATP-binding protein [Frankia sp. Cr2]|uniref:oligopeptide/dipeptide ABC transporter ATP-binding protein n=1 Tax=Frankia sp. Cr2 TaxID=3073932 RepID=UPI002AD4B355|nr:oligopeptide/dipeptide ABC transporter ATP-binding protein [Frankia sp. Cr2]